MSQDLYALKEYFAKLNLEPDIGSLYIVLCVHGPQTMAGLSRHSGVERTRIYRLREAMDNSGLFLTTTDHKRREMFAAAPIDNLQLLLARKEEELEHLQNEFQKMQQLYQTALPRPEFTHVQVYRGHEGMKQLFWNQTRAKSEVLCILQHNMQSHIGATFFKRWVRKCNDNNLQFRGIVSETFQKDQRTWYDTHRNERLSHWQQRWVPQSLLAISHSTVIHDDKVIYYNWNVDEVYGVEIYNTEIARSQRQIFEVLWQQGTEAPDVKAPKGS